MRLKRGLGILRGENRGTVQVAVWHFSRPTRPSAEIGASAGFNLVADQYRFRFGRIDWGRADAAPLLQPEWSGNAPPAHLPLVIHSRQSCDLEPVSIHDAVQRERLMSYFFCMSPA